MSRSQGASATADAVTRLTTRIAQEFGNVLTVVLAKADLLAESTPPAAMQARADLEDLRRAARRGADMTDMMLSFSWTQPVHPRPVDLARIVDGMKPALDRLLPNDVRMKISAAPPGLLRLNADVAAIQQILLNLVTNARDAVAASGTITISMERTASDAGGEWVTLTISDTGTGIAPDARERVFEPFYTTKAPGRGVGLGLSLVQGLVRQHGGTVSVGDAPGGGTAVRVKLPAPPVAQQEAPTHEVQEAKARHRVLIAEDEEVIRHSSKRILERFGYEVLLAADGLEGLDRLMRSGGPVDLVISDIVMPGLDGLELHRRARQRGFTMPFLLMSGYQSDEVGGLLHDDPAADYLPKPWTVPELVSRVRRMLERPTPRECSEAPR